MITSSTRAGSSFVRASTSRTTSSPSFCAERSLSAPPKFPSGVRAPDTITTFFIAQLLMLILTRRSADTDLWRRFFPQHTPQRLADERARQFLPKFHRTGNLELRQPLPAIPDQLLLTETVAVREHHVGLHRFTEQRIRHTDHHGILHRRVTTEHILHFPRIDSLSPRLDHVFLPVYQVEEPPGVLPGNVAGVEPPVAQHRAGLRRLVPVALHHLRSSDDQLAQPPRRHRPFAGVQVHEADIGVRKRDPDRPLRVFPVDRVAMGDRAGLRQTIPFRDLYADQAPNRSCTSARSGLAPLRQTRSDRRSYRPTFGDSLSFMNMAGMPEKIVTRYF